MGKKKYTYNYNKICEICNKNFQTHRYNTKICSKECVKEKLSQRRKFTEDQVNSVIKLRLEGLIISEITKRTGIGRPSLQKIFKENNIKLSEEDKASALKRRWKNHKPIVNSKKQCSKCKEYKNLEEFHKSKDRFCGVVSSCKKCSNIFYEENKEAVLERVSLYRENNLEKIKENYYKYYEENKEIYIERAQIWATNNPEKRKEITKNYADRNKNAKIARTAMYRARRRMATPAWLSDKQIEEIKQIYIHRPEGHCVDHIVPIGGENVCGLHVPWNLQYLPEYQNESKGNKFNDFSKNIGICHQYKRKQETLKEDIDNNMPFDSVIDDFYFNKESFNEEHKNFIKKYEWLGTIGYSPKWIFTARTNGKLGGIVIVTEPNAYTDKKEGKLLEAQITRGATASWTPKNLGSKLLMFACNWMVSNTTKRLFFGYSDHEAGEIGTIYQACNFNYLGAYFGSPNKYKLENGKLVNSRYFTKTSTFKKYAKELGIEWQSEWTKTNKYMNIKIIPNDILKLLKNKAKENVHSCEQIIQKPKGKYVLILGKNKRDKNLISIKYLKIFGKFEPYPKRK
jgi:hypothetical protein